jgi:hypothetical protein
MADELPAKSDKRERSQFPLNRMWLWDSLY